MISKLSEEAANILCDSGAIAKDDRELYAYGVFVLSSKVFYLMLSALLGLMFEIVLESLTFYVMFSAIRGYAGGIHSSSERTCMICTSLALLTCTAAMKVCIVYSLLVLPIILFVLSTICILTLSPLDTEGKRLTEEEKREYRKKSYLVTAFIMLTAALSLTFKSTLEFYPCVLSLLLESVLLILGKLKKPLQTNRL